MERPIPLPEYVHVPAVAPLGSVQAAKPEVGETNSAKGDSAATINSERCIDMKTP
jgi:hypothetical protein